MSQSNFGELKEKIPEWTADDEDIVFIASLILSFSC